MILFVQGLNAQDVAVTGYSSPDNGCEMSANETIKVSIYNKKNSSVTGVVPSYSINSGPWVSASAISLGPSASFVYTFSQTVDLSDCDQDFTIDVKLELTYSSDEDPSDNFISWTVRNDCHVITGTIESADTVCKNDNTGTLVLNGWQHGVLLNWYYTEDNATYTTIPGSSGNTSYTYNDLDTTTVFIIEFDEGHCSVGGAPVYSDSVQITVQPPPNPGTMTGPDSLCISNASGTIDLTGTTDSILDWESSEDGTTWTTLGNTTYSHNFSSLSQTTMFRADIYGGVCTGTYSDTFTVVVSDLSDAGVLNSDSIFCGSGSLDLILDSFTGDIGYWESSSDGTTWNPNPNTGDTLNTGSLTDSKYYRTIVKNGMCPSDTSNQVFIEIQPELNTGTINGGGSYCETNATGTLTISGNSGNVIKWQSSTNEGLNWSDISNASSTETFSNLSQSTWYRALIDGGACASEYSDTAIINVSPESEGGTLAADASVCIGTNDTLELSGNVGEVISWDESDDGTTWSTLNTNDSSYVIDPVEESKYYRVIVKSGDCEKDTSNTVFIDALPLPVADAGSNINILPDDSVQLQGSGGVIGFWVAEPSLSDTSIYNPYAAPSATTTYKLYVINSDGCIDYDEVTVAVGGALSLLDIKNVITANGDGFNDSWIIEGAEYFPNIDVKVYNIYGNLVYEDTDYQNDWAGDYKGKALPDGTYMYIVMPGETDSVLKGNLTILGGHE